MVYALRSIGVCLCWAFVLLAVNGIAPFAHAATDDSAKPKEATVTADHIAYDKASTIVTASGNVEVAYGDRILRADNVAYDRTRGVVHASGHVAVMMPSGQVMFADSGEMTGDLKDGFVEKVGMMFPDKSRFIAQSAKRYDGRWIVAEKGVYSACDLCADDPRKPPLWQVKAARITHDSVEKNIMYRDVTLEFDGVPAFYMPYFSHPDPTVKRRQGFLTPTGGYSQYIGTAVRVPYYFDLAPNSDLVLAPTFSTTDKLQMNTTWRYRLARGSMQWNGSVTRADLKDESGVDQGRQWRGHLFGTTQFDLNNTWRAGTEIAFASDKSYLPRYQISTEDVLLNRGYLEGFRGRDYAETNMYYFQDLRPGSQETEPLVFPDFRFSALGDPGRTLGGRWSLDGGLLVTNRKTNSVSADEQGPNTRRLATAAGWQRQMISNTGLVFNLSTLARMDGYWADHVRDTGQASDFSDIAKIRQFAQGDIMARYPMARQGDGYQQILEPIAVLTAAPDIGPNQSLPNEDSVDVEFDETSLFQPNRFTGIDRLEGGLRAAYGMRHALVGANGARLEAIGGQIVRMERDEAFPDGSGLRDRFSDIVGRFDVSPGPWFNANYGFRLDRDSFAFQRQELQASAGAPVFRPFVNYLAINQTPATGIAERVEEITFAFSSVFTRYWTLTGSHKRSILPDPGPRQTGLGLTYEDECFRIGFSAQRDYTDRQDVSTGDTFMFHFYLKNIGGLDSGGLTSTSSTSNSTSTSLPWTLASQQPNVP